MAVGGIPEEVIFPFEGEERSSWGSDHVRLSPLASSVAWRALKRSMDVVLALLLILLTLPLMTVIVLAIKIESRGPIFFVHRRIGRRADFGLIKFRTMVRDAHTALEQHLQDNPDLMLEWSESYKLRNDPRITRVGGVLRKTSLDELPQLFNILRGTMSLVGPRAIVRDEVERFGEYAPAVLSVKPGLTGLWAVSGRSEVAHRDRALLEYRYVTEWNLLLDLRILLRTVPAVVRGHGAY